MLIDIIMQFLQLFLWGVRFDVGLDMAQPVISRDGIGEDFQKTLSVFQENTGPSIPTGSDVINCSWIFYSKGASHDVVSKS
ncbi:hypothetical protein [Desulfospira joergensenii]|uniref:hypothetical protein n=1 Tax=Desulfospira joergensenii TaxID=53329 RepID=UPI001FC8FB0A|nr:hypothetical protein [Desulfospira joergensenii]